MYYSQKGTKYGIIKYDSEGRQEMVPFEYSYIDKVFDISEEDRGVSFLSATMIMAQQS